ncbi:MAG: acyltransferase, partial [bacterium]
TIRIGKRVLLAEGLSLDYSGGVEIGDDVWLSEDVMIHTHIHPLNERRIYSRSAEIETKPLKIGDCAWIGARAVILPGVETIGRNSVVGAGSVVTKNVPENAVVAGNPAKIIKKASDYEDRRESP